MSNSEKLVKVYQAAGEMEAQVIKGLLESNGIPCLLESSAAPSGHSNESLAFRFFLVLTSCTPRA